VLLSWILIISPQVLAPDVPIVQRIISVAYPIGDVLILVTVIRLVIVDRVNTSLVLLIIGSTGLLFADILYGLLRLHGDWAIGGLTDIGWIVFYVAWGAAALHPSMAGLTEPRARRTHEISTTRQVILLTTALAPQIILLVEVTRGEVRHATVIAFAALTTGILVIIRLLGVIASHRRTIARSDTLRNASAALMSAEDVTDVTYALQRSTLQLLPPDRRHRFVMRMNDGGELFTQYGFDQGGVRLLYTTDLPPEIAARLEGYEVTLACPLVLDDRPTGHPVIGTVLVSSDVATLGMLQAPMEMMVSQAALAIERIQLNHQITRHNNERYFRTLVQNATDVILIVERGPHYIRYASPSAAELFGTEDIVGSCLLEHVDDETREAAQQHLTGGEQASGDWVLIRGDGSRLHVQTTARDVSDDPTVAGIIVTLRDVTAARAMEAELTHLAYHDPLTGLVNRTLFQERLAAAVDRAAEAGQVAGVLFIDLDDFKVVNDTLGHNSGDELLRAVAERLVGVLRFDDTAARLGGDEFAALIEDAPTAEAIEEVAGRIVSALAEPFTVDNQIVSGVASVGIATTADAAGGDDLLRQADLALYVAKDAGKGQWRRYLPALHTVILERLELRAELETSIAAGEFSLDYQPIVGLPEGEIRGFEALVRWNHPVRGRLLPGHFIDVAEESGQIVPLGAWILTEAVRTAKTWHDHTDDAPYVSVNVSPRQFHSPGFLDSVHAALDSAGLPPSQLTIEITESLLLRDDDRIWEDLATLRARGVRIAIDDFGTGYSSLSYLRQVPLDAVKLDRLFTATCTSDHKQADLVDGIIRLARTLGLDVVAEGIETQAESELLTRLGCPFGQGYLFARPLAAVDALAAITPRALV
jgi:diguanylate cyclase (GGDEF)-like protein/PAS domain S-box-containing protein